VLVETDSPYLAPVPLRGKRCEPAFVVHTGKYVAALRGTDEAHFAALTTDNARRCFRLPLAAS
jgi:TatD DNase family protein